MNRVITSLVIACILCSSRTRTAVAQSGSDVFQQALRKERVDGDLKGAIALYQRILKDYANDRALSASVLVQLGSAYEKQGSTEAQAAYQRVVREFADQPNQIVRAQARLDALASTITAREASGPTLRRVWADAPGAGGASADGRILSFADRRTGQLGVRDLTTGETRMLTENPPRPWQVYALGNVPSRDGRFVAYSWYSGPHPVELRVGSTRGGEPRVLVSNPAIEFIAPLDWSPDGKQIVAFAVRKDRVGQIAIISALDGSLRVLKTFGWRVAPGRMGFSPDGKFIAYNFAPRDDANQRDIYIIATDASVESVFAGTIDDEQFLGWTPDGKHVLYATGQAEQRSIWLARVEAGRPTGDATLVRRNAGAAEPMGITNRGTFLFGVAAPSPIRALSVALDSTRPRSSSPTPITLDRPEAWAAQWSHDGQAFVYASSAKPDDSRATHLIVRTTSTSAERVVPAVDLAYAYSTRWSPDDRYLMVVGQDKKGRRGVFRVDPSSGATTLIIAAAAGADEVFAGWTADAKSVIYTENVGQPLVTGIVRQRDLQTGEERELMRLPGIAIGSPKISPDFKRLAFLSRDSGNSSMKSLKVVELGTGESSHATTLARAGDIGPFTWSTNGHSLYYVVPSDGERQTSAESSKDRLMRVSTTGGDGSEVPISIPSRSIGIQMHPGGDKLLFTAHSSSPGQRDIWAMENFLPTSGLPGGGARR